MARKKTARETHRLQVRLLADDYETLEILADDDMVPVAVLVRQAIRDYLRRRNAT